MNVQCSQEALKRALAACARLRYTYPVSTHVCLTAKEPSAKQPGCLEVCAWSAHQTIGLVARLPAQVEQAGRAIVPAQVMSDGLASAHSGQVTLSLVEVEDPPTAPPVSKPEEQIKALKGGPALQIESASTSARGTASTRRIRIRLCIWPQGEAVTMPDLAFWRTTGFRLAEVEPVRLRAALKPCLALARQRDEPSESAPDMNHALVLVRFDTAQLQWTATTRHAVASKQLPLLSPTRFLLSVPFSHALFDERDLAWITAALGRVKQPVTLTLVPQAGHQVVLLVESAHLTLFCLGVTEPIPFVWERRLQLPATTAALVPRTPFLQALSFFWMAHEGEKPHLQIRVTRDLLCLQWNKAGDAAVAIEQQIPLVKPAEEISPMLVDLQQMRQFVQLLKGGRVISLEMGTFQRKGTLEEAAKVVEFLRLSVADDPSTQLMMTTSRFASPPANTAQNATPAVPRVQPDAEQKEAALANA